MGIVPVLKVFQDRGKLKGWGVRVSFYFLVPFEILCAFLQYSCPVPS